MKAPPLVRDTLQHFLRTDCLPGELHVDKATMTEIYYSVNHGPWNHRTGAPRHSLLWAQCIQKSHTNDKVITKLKQYYSTHTRKCIVNSQAQSI